MQNGNDSFAFYRLPGQTTAWYIEGRCLPEMPSIETLMDSKYFVISPFNKQDQTYAIQINSDRVFEANTHNDQFYHFSGRNYTSREKSHYLNLVNTAIQQMKSDCDFHKVVLARIKTIPLENFDPIHLFSLLEETFPAAFVYLVSSPTTGTWLGATPELLLQSSTTKMETVALAGTLPNLNLYKWSSKEKEEQHLVELYIEKILDENNFSFRKEGPSNLISGNLKHLQTKYNIKTPSVYAKNRISQLIGCLNPTSAVGGMEKEKAIRFIVEHEDFDRCFYSGFVGLFEPNNQRLYVNLRCMEWQYNKAILFAGAGITVHSDAESEFLETSGKMNALEQFLIPTK